MSPRSRAYAKMAATAIQELLAKEHAAATAEFDAKIADRPWPGLGTIIEPLHISSARTILEMNGTIEVRTVTSRGAHSVPIATLSSPKSRTSTAVSRATSRKGLLMSRYLGWAQGTASRPGVIGPATEKVVQESLLAAAPNGYRVEGPGDTFLDVEINGPLDNRAFYTPIVDGIPRAPIAVPIEVKGGRDWLMAGDYQPYQLLDKAAQLKTAQPDVPIAPLFFCRRAHMTLFRMAKDLGFFIIPANRQFISPSVDEEKIIEVRSELGFLDLEATATADDQLVRRLTKAFPKQAEITAVRWERTACHSDLPTWFEQMRDSHDRGERAELFHEVRSAAKDAGLYVTRGW